MQFVTFWSVLLILLTSVASSWGLKFSFTNNTDLEIFVNQTLIMNCSSDEEIGWTVPSKSQASIKRISSNVASIVISRANKSDDGDYVCGSKNNSNQFARIHIRVTGLKCSFINGTEFTVPLNEKYEFRCSSQAGVECTIPLRSGASIKTISSFEESISSNGALPSDYGDYVCRSKTNSKEFAFVSLKVAESIHTSNSSLSLVLIVVIVGVILSYGAYVAWNHYEKRIQSLREPPVWYVPNREENQDVDSVRNEQPMEEAVESLESGALSSVITSSVPENPAGDSLMKFHINEINIQEFEEFGRGAFGKVLVGQLENHPFTERIVIKNPNEPGHQKDLEHEAEIMRDLVHPNVLRIIGVVYEPNGFSLYGAIFEFMELGDLLKIFRNNTMELSQDDLLNICHQFSKGMEYLVQKRIIHRDIACRNCLIGTPPLTAKVCDFGLARRMNIHDEYMINMDIDQGKRRLPASRLAPESIIHGKFSSGSDAWMYGVFLWETFNRGAQPYPNLDFEEIRTIILDGGDLTLPADCPEIIAQIMDSCCEFNVQHRIAFAQICEKLGSAVHPSTSGV